jgi:high affinity Mn2+ porin
MRRTVGTACRTKLLAVPWLALACTAVRGQGAVPEGGAPLACYGQATYVEQETLGFRAPYRGPNSLSARSGRETVDATLYAGARLWHAAELWVNSEIDQGFGLDDTRGLAGFPSGEAYRVGRSVPYLRLPRAFLRQTLSFGEPSERQAGGPNQFPAYRSPDRLVITVGKFAVTDVFDTNQYAHDPRSDFLNWSAIDAGTFDYAADAWGYTVGAAAEAFLGSWTWRAGVFDLSNVPNSAHLEPALHEFQLLGELERRHEIGGRPGRVQLTAFDSRGRMGLLDEAVSAAAASGMPVDIAAVRSFRSRLGVSASLEQQLAPDLGLFARLGKAAGNVETFEFTDLDRAIEAGGSLQGNSWGRAHDTLALAAMLNGISAARERYLDAGGLGIVVGDGRLPHPGAEKIVETYYQAALRDWLRVTGDYQWVGNPAYNRDRGPVSILALRVHLQF